LVLSLWSCGGENKGQLFNFSVVFCLLSFGYFVCTRLTNYIKLYHGTLSQKQLEIQALRCKYVPIGTVGFRESATPLPCYYATFLAFEIGTVAKTHNKSPTHSVDNSAHGTQKALKTRQTSCLSSKRSLCERNWFGRDGTGIRVVRTPC
jgi:hypothetical protein